METGKGKVVVYPNPVTDGTIRLQMSGLPAGRYTTRLVSPAGQVVQVKDLNHAGAFSQQALLLPIRISKGMYILYVERNGEKLHDIKVMIQ